jgi:hypothetical protein
MRRELAGWTAHPQKCIFATCVGKAGADFSCDALKVGKYAVLKVCPWVILRHAPWCLDCGRRLTGHPILGAEFWPSIA